MCLILLACSLPSSKKALALSSSLGLDCQHPDEFQGPNGVQEVFTEMQIVNSFPAVVCRLASWPAAWLVCCNDWETLPSVTTTSGSTDSDSALFMREES